MSPPNPRALLLNPAAGCFRRCPGLIHRLTLAMGEWGPVYISSSLKSLADLARKIRTVKTKELAICGGDGTVQRTVAALRDAYAEAPLPQLLLLPGGTMNVVAGALPLRGNPEAVLRRAVAAWREGRPLPSRRLGFLNVNGEVGFIFGIGCFERLITLYARSPGRRSAMWMLARALLAALGAGSEKRLFFPEIEMTLAPAGGLPRRERLVGVGFSTVDHLGFGSRPFYLAGKNPAFGHLITLRWPLASLLLKLPQLYRGRPAGHAALSEALLPRLSITTYGDTPFMMDGELYPPTSAFDIRVAGDCSFLLP